MSDPPEAKNALLTIYVVALIVVWIAIFVVRYFVRGQTAGYPILHVPGARYDFDVHRYTILRIWPMSGLSRFGLWTMALLAFGIALSSLRFVLVPWNIWLGIDTAIRGVVERVPVQMLGHALVAPFALFLGPFQFFARLRSRHPAIHRWTGRSYVVAVMIGGLAGLATAPFASGGPIAALGFGTLAISWLGVTFFGWRAAVARNFERHRLLMRFSYAMTFGAVTLRLQIPLGFIFLHFASYRDMSVWLAWTSWLPNVAVVGLYSLTATMRARSGPSTVAA